MAGHSNAAQLVELTNQAASIRPDGKLSRFYAEPLNRPDDEGILGNVLESAWYCDEQMPLHMYTQFP
jgi:hypothetical protein